MGKNTNVIKGEDSISFKDNKNRLIYHIRFHLADDMVLNFTNNKKLI